MYVVDWSPEKMGALGEGVGRAAATATIDPLKPITLIGVAALGEPDILIEVEAIASLRFVAGSPDVGHIAPDHR